MLATTPKQGYPDSMTTRSATLVTIGVLTVLMSVVAIAALFANDISERAGAIVTTVLGSFATVLAGLLLFLRVENVNAKVDDAAVKAGIAVEKAEAIHHDMLNGGLRENVKKAISEDRHAKAQRDTVEQARMQMEERLARRGEQPPPDRRA